MNEKVFLGVSELLPANARAALLRGYREALGYPEESVERKRVIDRAIDAAKSLAPRKYFVDEAWKPSTTPKCER